MEAAFDDSQEVERSGQLGAELVKRLVLADLRYIERLFQPRRGKPRAWSKAIYPPGCTPRRGPVRFEAKPGGALLMRVTRADLENDDVGFRLRMLFSVGVGAFSSPRDLYEFAKGPLADAFGIEVDTDSLPFDATDRTQSSEEASATGRRAGPDETAVKDSIRRTARTFNRAALEEPDRPLLASDQVALGLARFVKGQEQALAQVSRVVCGQWAKRAPTRPATIMLLGPTGTGKTTTVESLPGALGSLGHADAHVFRVDCGELSQSFQVSRLIGAPPGYVGYQDSPKLLDALEEPGCILLLDDVDKAHSSVLGDVLLNLIDRGRLTAPNGRTVHAAHSVIAMTSNLAADELESKLYRVPLGNRRAVQRICRETLSEEGFPDELMSRIGNFAVYESLNADVLREAATVAIETVSAEYGFEVREIDPVVIDVVLDIAGEIGADPRSLYAAAGDLLSEALITAVGRFISGSVRVEAGPPIVVCR